MTARADARGAPQNLAAGIIFHLGDRGKLLGLGNEPLFEGHTGAVEASPLCGLQRRHLHEE